MTILLISIWIIIIIYLINRGIYKVDILVNNKIVHSYYTNYQPITGDTIAVDISQPD